MESITYIGHIGYCLFLLDITFYEFNIIFIIFNRRFHLFLSSMFDQAKSRVRESVNCEMACRLLLHEGQSFRKKQFVSVAF